MRNKFKRFISVAVVLFMLFIPNFSLAEEYIRTELLNENFDEGYTATEANPAIPGELVGSLNNGGIVYADVVDSEHGTSVAVEDPDGKAPWFGTADYSGENLVKGCSVKFSFEFLSKTAKDYVVVNMRGEDSEATGVFNRLMYIQNNKGTITYTGVTAENAVSEELLDEYSTYSADVWYKFEFTVDLTANTYSLAVGKDGATPETVAENIALTTPIVGMRQFRITARDRYTDARFDNICLTKILLKPEITDVSFNEALGTVKLTYNKEMDVTSFTDKVKLVMGNEEVEVPFSGSYSNKVYTITTGSAFKKGITYTLKLAEGIKCVGGSEMSGENYVFDAVPEGTVIKNSDVVFDSDSDTISAKITLPAEVTEPSVKLVLGAYSGDILVDIDAITLSAGVVTSPVTLSCSATGIDGAVVYLMDSDYKPLCDSVVMENSNITTGVRNDNVPANFADYSYDSVNNIVKVYGRAIPGEMITVISAQGETVNLIKPSAVRQVMAKENGYYEIIFKNDTGKVGDNFKFPSDDYTILVTSETQQETLKYKYSNDIEAVSALEEVQSADDVDDIENIIKNHSKIFALDKTDYETVDKTTVHTLILTENLAAYTTSGEFKNAFDRAVCIALLNKGAGALETLGKYGEDFGLNISEFTSLPDTELAAEIIESETYTSFEGFLDTYEDAKMLTIISNASNATNMKEYLMTTYVSELNVLANEAIADKYENVIEKSAVLVKLLDRDFKSVTELKTAFENAVSAVYKKENLKEPQGSGGSGGGGRGTVSVDVNANKNADDKEVSLIKFTDIEAEDSEMLYKLVAKGVIEGDGNGKFRPNDKVRRDEIMKMIVIGLEMENTAASSPFTDVSKDNWSYPYISSAYSAGIVNGVGDNLFAPERNVSIQDSVTMLYRAAEKAGLIEQYKNIENSNFIADAGDIADYAVEAVSFVYSYILDTDESDKVRPKESATRLETATLVYKFMQFMNGGL